MPTTKKSRKGGGETATKKNNSKKNNSKKNNSKKPSPVKKTQKTLKKSPPPPSLPQKSATTTTTKQKSAKKRVAHAAKQAIKYVTGGGEPEEEKEEEKVAEEEDDEKEMRSRDYECYKISDKNLCDNNSRCLWENTWTNMFTRNKCKSKLFHSLKISYPAKPTDFKKIIESLEMLEAKSERMKLTKNEEIDLRILQEFRDDYVLFDAEVKSSVLHKMNLQRLYDVEKNSKKKQEIKKELDELNKTTMGRIKDFLTRRDVLMFFMASLMAVVGIYLAKLGIGQIGGTILDQYQQYATVNNVSHTTQTSNNINLIKEQVIQSGVNLETVRATTDQYFAQTGLVNAQTLYSKQSGTENVMRAGANFANAGTAYFNPFYYGAETAKDVLRDDKITGNVGAVYGEGKNLLGGLGGGLGWAGSKVGSGLYSVGSSIAGLWSSAPAASSPSV